MHGISTDDRKGKKCIFLNYCRVIISGDLITFTSYGSLYNYK